MLGAAAGVSAPRFLRSARAAAPFVSTQVPYWYRFRIGDYEATVASDGPLSLGKPDTAFKGLPREELERLLKDNFLPPDFVTLEQNALVVNTGRNLILFDTGMGTAKAFGPSTGKLLDNLRAAGIDPAQIDSVCITHAHIDHCWALVGDEEKRISPTQRSISPRPTSISGPTRASSAATIG